MRWRMRNLSVAVDQYNDQEREWLTRYLSYGQMLFGKNKGPKYKQISLFNQFHQEFPAGLAMSAWKEAKAKGFMVEVVDERVRPCDPDPHADLQWLRSHPAVTGEITHQIEAVEAIIKKRRGIIWVPTGGGKTEIAIGAAKALPCRWLFLVHKVDLLKQTADRYELRTGLPAGIVGSGTYKVPDDCRFVVCGFQTAHRGILAGKGQIVELLGEWAQGIIVDEVHSLGADTYHATAMSTPNAYFRIGLSATPLARSKEKRLRVVGALGPVIYRIRPQVLAKLGLLATPTIRMRMFQHNPLKNTGKHIGKALDGWKAVYNTCIMNNAKRNALVVDITAQAKKPAMVFVHRVNHGKDLTKLIEKSGINAQFAWGGKSTKQREDLITQLERGYFDVMVCNVVFQEGIDVPSLGSVVNASGMKSIIAAVQRMGRGMRADAKTGKDTFEMWDINDVGCGCTKANRVLNDDPMLDDPTAKTSHDACRLLESHTKERRKAYQGEGFAVEFETNQLKLAL